jgi:SH3-like domain-containing protein
MRLYIAVFLVIVSVGFSCAEIQSVKVSSASIHDSADPFAAQVVLVVPRYYPLNVIGEEGDYYRINDFLGREGWVEKSALEPGTTVVLKVNSGNIRNGPGVKHDLLFHAKQGVAFKVLDQKGDWLRIEHESGRIGWISRNLVWGDNYRYALNAKNGNQPRIQQLVVSPPPAVD